MTTDEPNERGGRTPAVLTNTAQPDSGPGVQWKLADPARDLDANVVALTAGAHIGAHYGPDIDVLMHILEGSGTLETDAGALELATGALVLLPRKSLRSFTAGPGGLRYLTVHQRRQSLTLGPIGGHATPA